jgi:hypothetical protein
MNIGMIIFIVILIIIIIIIIYSYISNKNVLTKLSDATIQQTISASSLATNSNPGSSNFAYSIWFYINNWNYKYGEIKVIFGRMNSVSGNPNPNTQLGGISPSPLVTLGALSNDLDIALTVFSSTNSNEIFDISGNSQVTHCGIQNVPIQQWVNLIISVYGRTLDTYINGKLVRTCLLPGVANINQNTNVYVTPNGGFDGSTSNFSYYPNALNPEQAWNIYEYGYGTGILSNIFGSYQLNISLLQNGTQEASLTI